MGFLDRLFGAEGARPQPVAPADAASRRVADRTLMRYRSVLRAAPAETIQQVHAQAFERLTDGQRALIYEELSRGAATGERPLSSEPATLARAATRAESRTPGALERSLSGSAAGVVPGAPEAGSPLASSILGEVAAHVTASRLVSAFLPWEAGYPDAAAEASGSGSASDAAASGRDSAR